MATKRQAPDAGRGIPRRGVGTPTWRVHVLGDFRVDDRGGPVALPESTCRLVALLAIGGRPLRRVRAAVQLWPDKDEERAQANLRSSLWRLRQATPGLVHCDGDRLGFGDSVRVDLADLLSLAERLEDSDPCPPAAGDVDLCCADLLPDWYDDFVDEQRELVRQLRLRTLELLGRRLKETGHCGSALRLALTAVAQAPMRESAHQLVLEIHLAEGNASEALRHYQSLKTMLWQELGIRPSERMRATMAPWARIEERIAPERIGVRKGA